MKYQVLLLPKAQKDLDKFRGKEFSKLSKFIANLANNPRCMGSVKLTNEGGHRIRAGIYRILYRIDDGEKKIFIYRVGHRKEVYR